MASRVIFSVCLLLCAPLSGCVVGAVSERAERERVFHEVVSELSSPAMEGRGAGTAGLDRARDYVEEHFRRVGLGPAFRGGGEGSYLQPFEVRLGGEATRRSLGLRVAEGWRTVEDDLFSVLGFSAGGGFEGQAVFVGYGIVNEEQKYDSYRGLEEGQMRGKVAVVFRYEPQDERSRSLWAGKGAAAGPWTESASLINKARWAAERGAVAMLVVNPPKQDQGNLKTTSGSMAPEDAAIPVLHIRTSLFEKLIGLSGREPGEVVRVYQQQADEGAGAAEQWPGVVVRGEVELEKRMGTIANVGGFWKGEGELRDEVLVVGAHYDHLGYGEVGSLAGEGQVHPGADDNASGVAGLILLAEGVARLRDQGAEVGDSRGRRSVLFLAFSGEERGLLGSTYFLKHLDDVGVKLGQVVAMINFDMIGRIQGKKVFVVGTGSGDRWGELISDLDRETRLKIVRNQRPYGGSDHMSFLAREVPAVHFFTGTHRDYHRPSDMADKVNVAGAVELVSVTGVLLERLATDPKRLTFVYDPATSMYGGDHGYGESGGAFLGVVPDYTSMDGDRGCVLAGVLPDSPAKAAGLKADDVIVKWNGEEIGNVRGLSLRLRESQPGQEVVMVVLRDGREIEVRVVLSKRS